MKSKRVVAAFAFKGRATQGSLTPKKMGSGGDQIGRLIMSSEADVFFVVYHSKVEESVFSQLHVYALGRSMQGRKVTYGVIDGDDLNRLRICNGHPASLVVRNQRLPNIKFSNFFVPSSFEPDGREQVRVK